MKLENIKIIMVETSHQGNVGAAARAMNNMGISDLALVSPQCKLGVEAYARASGAHEILGNHQKFDNIADAITDCHLVVGTSARSRSLSWPTLSPDELVNKVIQFDESKKLAVLFGSERVGLTNEQLHHCHYAVSIPTNPDFSSLNVASAVQVICYELFKKLSDQTLMTKKPEDEPASGAENEGFFEHLEQILLSTGFLNPEQPKYLMTRLRRFFLRAEPNKKEINILRGILNSVEQFKS